MRFIVGNTDGKTLGLNANELCVLEAISKCSRKEDAKGWYGSMQALADSLPFVIDRMTVDRAVKKLHSFGLLEKRENNTWVIAQNVQSIAQNVQCDAQNVQPIAQNVQPIAQNVQKSTPLNNPPIINNNMNEKEKEQPRALCTHDGAKQPDALFDRFWSLYEVAPEFQNRRNATKAAFEARTKVAQCEIIKALEEHLGMKGNPNPYFFVVDFPEPQPTFLRGDEPGDIVQVRYNGAYKLCTRETMERFNLQWERDW